MGNSTCSVDECTGSRFQERLCSPHLIEARLSRVDLCSMCDGPRWADGLCGSHWSKQQRARNPRDSATRSAYERDRRAKNPDRVRQQWRAARAKRRAIERGADAEDFLPVDVFDRDGWRCGICDRPVKRALGHPHPMSASLDHVIPISQGGSHTMANTRCSHLSCNIRRSNRGGSEQLRLVGSV